MTGTNNFDLVLLEDSLILSYSKFRKDSESQSARHNLYVSIKELSFAVMSVNPKYQSEGLDKDEVSYEYSLYLFERLIIGTFLPKPKAGTRFPWQKYISLNIRHIIYTKRDDLAWRDLITDVGFLAENDDDYFTKLSDKAPLPDASYEAEHLAEHFYSGVRMFYTEDQIRRLYPLASDLLFSTSRRHSTVPSDIPEDLSEFIKVIISIAKRLTKTYNINKSFNNVSSGDFKKALKSSIRSTLFLSTIANTNIVPKELLLSLDIDSLYRLVSIAGGQFLRIPSMKELDSLLGAVVSVSKIIIEGKSIEKALNESKSEFELIFSNKINIRYFISKIIESYNFSGRDNTLGSSDPLVNVVLHSIKSIEVLLPRLLDKTQDSSPEFLLEFYRELSTSMSNLTDSLVKVDDLLEFSDASKG